MEVSIYGENGFTIEFFQKISFNEKARKHFFENIKFNRQSKSLEDYGDLQNIYLFPNFGKRWGFGEPDAILITENAVLYIEVETFIETSKWLKTVQNMASGIHENRLKAFKLYKKTPLYQLERFYTITKAVVKNETNTGDNKRRLCATLPISDQYCYNDEYFINTVTFRDNPTLNHIIQHTINKGKEAYIVLLVIKMKQNKGRIAKYYDSLIVLREIWDNYREIYGDINYAKPEKLAIKVRKNVAKRMANSEFDIDRFGHYIAGKSRDDKTDYTEETLE